MTRVESRWGRIDVVFANAGVSVDTSFTSSAGAKPSEWTDMVVTNVCGPAFTARAAMPALIRSGGHLVLTGSAAGRGVRPGNLYRPPNGRSPGWRRRSGRRRWGPGCG